MSDLIDRQDVIDVLHGYFDGMLETDTWSPCDVYGLIEILPSAQTERWDTCFDCPLSHGCPVINGCTNEEAMQYAGDIADNCPLNKLERKGKWIYYDPNGFKCSRCGSYLEIECGDVKMNFCPNCGCRMEEGE